MGVSLAAAACFILFHGYRWNILPHQTGQAARAWSDMISDYRHTPGEADAKRRQRASQRLGLPHGPRALAAATGHYAEGRQALGLIDRVDGPASAPTTATTGLRKTEQQHSTRDARWIDTDGTFHAPPTA